jgi:hypothetical protein
LAVKQISTIELHINDDDDDDCEWRMNVYNII